MGILIISDNAGIGCANWVLIAIIRAIAEILDEKKCIALADWLTSDTSPVYLYSDLDIRDLTTENQEVFLSAIRPAFMREKERGPIGWKAPSAWEGYIALFEKLVEQSDLISRGETPTKLPNLNGVPKHDGTRAGPGW